MAESYYTVNKSASHLSEDFSWKVVIGSEYL